MSTTSPGVVHVIAATLRADTDVSLVDAALERARALRVAPGARRVVLARSEQALLVAIWLPDRAALEPFVASPEHMAFVMRGLAPCIAGMWSAAVESAGPPPSTDEPFEALWVFAVRTSGSAFEWQVRDVLHSLDPLPAAVAAGPTFEERDRYRAGGVACIPAGGSMAFHASLDAARAAWGDMAPDLVESIAPVVE